MLKALSTHWVDYLLEAAGLGVFMIAAGVMASWIYSPDSILHTVIQNRWLRDVIMAVSMGITAIGIIYSPWGKRTGAHINPAVTITFFRLKKIGLWDALFYVLAQFIGGTLGVMLVAVILGNLFTQPPVNYVATRPGAWGWMVALITEFLLSMGMISMVLINTNIKRTAHLTGLFAGILVAIYIVVAAPVSGMSINPARTFASALPSQIWDFIWIYFVGPLAGMLLGAELYLRIWGRPEILCTKLCPNARYSCICSDCCVARRFEVSEPATIEK